jgi:hypothetical protein
MSKPKLEVSAIIGACLAYPVLVLGIGCYYTGKGLTTVGSFMIESSGLVPPIATPPANN